MDYYSLQAVFAGVDKVDRPYDENAEIANKRKQFLSRKRQLDKKIIPHDIFLKNELTEIEKKLLQVNRDWKTLSSPLVSSRNGNMFTPKSDGSFLSIGPVPEKDIVTFKSKLILEEVTAFQLDVLTDKSLPKNGPGHAINGNLHLSEVVVRENDDLLSLRSKVRIATMLGTFQSTLTDLKYLRKVWKTNTEEERLLGVSLTGIMDHYVLSKQVDSKVWLQEMKQVAIQTNKEYAEKIGIPRSTAITCVKPSGTVSQLTDSASGIHARHNDFYVRTVRGDNKDPLTQFMKEEGIPFEADITKPDSVTVFSFPMKSPSGAITRTEMSAIEQLAIWKIYQVNWCEHKPSVTISVKEDEWMAVGAWVYENFDYMSGVSFLPHSDHIYKQAPYQDCTEKEYNEFVKKMPKDVDWGLLSKYELSDQTIASQELACTGPEGCDVTFSTPTGIGGIS